MPFDGGNDLLVEIQNDDARTNADANEDSLNHRLTRSEGRQATLLVGRPQRISGPLPIPPESAALICDTLRDLHLSHTEVSRAAMYSHSLWRHSQVETNAATVLFNRPVSLAVSPMSDPCRAAFRNAHGGSVVPDRQSTSCLQIAHSAEVSSEELLPGTARAEAELVGRFHYTTLVRNRPRTLGTWRVTTTSLLIADRVARLLGGYVEQDSARDVAEIMTTSSTIGILLAGPGALEIGWQHTDRNTCDGATQDDRQPCICPANFAQRRAAAKQGYGCRPHAEVRFRLQDDQTAGVFDIASEDWSFVELVTTIQAALSSRETWSPGMARVGLQRTLHTLRNGIVLPYTRPHIELLGDTRFPWLATPRWSAHDST